MGGTVWTADGKGTVHAPGVVVLRDGKIAAVGDARTPVPAGVRTIDVSGRWMTPGLIDAHSHLGVYASPGVEAHSDGNEATSPVTAEVSAEHGFWPQDPGLPRALAGGVTSMLILPGSANLIGGPRLRGQEPPGPLGGRAAVSRGALRAQDGLRREPQAGLRQEGGPLDPHGQRRPGARRLLAGGRLPAQVGHLAQEGPAQGRAAARRAI